MSKEILSPDFVVKVRQLTELDKLTFVAMVTNLPWRQR